MSELPSPKKLKTKQVFTPGGQPTVTYVDRAHLDLEGALTRAIKRGYSIISVTGQTKSGKTVLCRKIIPPAQALWLEAGQTKDESEFWAQAAYKLNLAQTVTKSKTDEHTDIASAEAGIGFSVGPFSISGKGGGSVQDKNSVLSSMSWMGNTKLQVLEHLREEDKPLIIDDFHYLPKEVQRNIVQTLNAEIFQGLTVIILSVPHRAFDPVTVEREMQGRFTHVEIPMWNIEDLSKIATSGFSALNVKCGNDIINKFADEAFKSPLLMQNFCSSLCLDKGVYEQCEIEHVLARTSQEVEEIFSQVSRDFGFPTYETLRRGPQSRTERNKKTFTNGGQGDIYEAVLNAVALTGPLDTLSYDDIRSALKKVLGDQTLQKHEVVRTLSHMSKIARENIPGEPVIEWDSKDGNGMLFITDPFLMFFLKWSIASKFNKRDRIMWIEEFIARTIPLPEISERTTIQAKHTSSIRLSNAQEVLRILFGMTKGVVKNAGENTEDSSDPNVEGGESKKE